MGRFGCGCVDDDAPDGSDSALVASDLSRLHADGRSQDQYIEVLKLIEGTDFTKTNDTVSFFESTVRMLIGR